MRLSLSRTALSRTALSFLALAIVALVPGCEDRRAPVLRDAGSSDGSAPPSARCVRGVADIQCDGATAVQCNDDGTERSRTDCMAMGQVCEAGTGCQVCRPGRFQCNGEAIERCADDGSAWVQHAMCDASAGLMCQQGSGECSSPCTAAVASNSYIGCEYWPTPTGNSVPYEFDFAVVVANPNSAPVSVTVSRAGTQVSQVSVAPGQTAAIKLPWIESLKETTDSNDAPRSSLTRGGAYRLVSTLPVSVYQFNPLDYVIPISQTGDFFPTDDCTGFDADPFDERCFSFSNDASLLLPTHVLTGDYIAVSERTLALSCNNEVSSTPGFVTIVGAEATPVEVTVTLAGNIAASGDGMVTAASAGAVQTYTLNQGDVLQLATAAVTSCVPGGTTAGQCGGGRDLIHCDVPDEFDLTGSRISANGKVMVIGGHTCAFMPSNRFACDHIEETVFPLETWGDDFIVSATQPLRSEPNIIRIVSGEEGNSITFDPASVHAPVTLGAGQVVEFETSADFRVQGSGPLLATQFLVGQNYSGSVEQDGAGDPAMSFAIPSEQFRTEYTFLAPASFEQNYVNITAPVGASVMLSSGGGAATEVSATWRSVGDSGMQTARVPIPGGSHTLTSSQPFGIVVYGFGSYTSYMYPGGLDFEVINPLI